MDTHTHTHNWHPVTCDQQLKSRNGCTMYIPTVWTSEQRGMRFCIFERYPGPVEVAIPHYLQDCLAFFSVGFTSEFLLHQEYKIWANYSDLSRSHPKWWFSRGMQPKIPKTCRFRNYRTFAQMKCIWMNSSNKNTNENGFLNPHELRIQTPFDRVGLMVEKPNPHVMDWTGEDIPGRWSISHDSVPIGSMGRLYLYLHEWLIVYQP